MKKLKEEYDKVIAESIKLPNNNEKQEKWLADLERQRNKTNKQFWKKVVEFFPKQGALIDSIQSFEQAWPFGIRNACGKLSCYVGHDSG